MNLSIRDILLLDYYNGKPIHTKIPKYHHRLYGADGDSRMRALCEDGWARVSQPEETLDKLPDKALAQALTARGLSADGTHADLVRRITENIPQSEYTHAVPMVYFPTAKGAKAIADHMAYVLNARYDYGFSDGEIGEARRALGSRGETPSGPDILVQAFSQKGALFVMAGEWAKLRNLYYRLSGFWLREGDKEKALTYLFVVFFLDLSGMENRNRLVPYEKLFPTQKGIIVLMNQLRRDLSLTDQAVKAAFLSTVARTAPPLPFSYFSPQIAGTILAERLNGTEFSHIRYFAQRSIPDPTATAYHYTPERQEESAPPAPFSKAPPVPPALRMPSFTAPAPVSPPKREARPGKEIKHGPHAKGEKKSPRLLGRLSRLWHRDKD